MGATRYLVTEFSFHTAYLIEKMKHLSGKIKIIVRDINNLDIIKLQSIHDELATLKFLSQNQIQRLEDAYQSKLTKAELALIAMHGVPRTHAFSLPNTACVTNLNSPLLLNTLELESFQQDLCAGIFLDCLLKPRWLEIFEHRIVNAHSAILPHARGMYAIEQIAAIGDPILMETCAGATIHYIDKQVDMGSLIRTRKLPSLWQYSDIWEVKAQSYLTAFDLLTEYLSHTNSFKHEDSFPYEHKIGPEFKAKYFTPEIATQAATSFMAMKTAQHQEKKSSQAPSTIKLK